MSHAPDVLAAASAVVPSEYGDAKFTTAAPRYRQGGGTSCTFGPHYFAYAAGCRAVELVNFDGEGCTFDVGRGVSKLYFGARKLGAWVEAGRGQRPKPGDFYLLHGPISGGQWDPKSEHVGTVRTSAGDVWTFDDFGQTNPSTGRQCARRVERTWDGSHLGSSVPGGAARLLGGWIDIDALTYTAAPLYRGASSIPWGPLGLILAGAACVLASEE